MLRLQRELNTGVKRRKANTRSEKVNNLKTAMKKNAQTQPRQMKQNQKGWSLKTYCINDKTF